MEITVKNRIQEIDIIKGIGIICMVACHAGSPGRNFFYLFHMAIFFIASGYTYNRNNSNDIQSYAKYVIKKIKQLYLPFVLWNSLFLLLNNFFIDINVYTNNNLFLELFNGKYACLTNYLSIKGIITKLIDILLFSGETQLGGAFWFLKVLFFISILYGLSELILKKCNIQRIKVFEYILSTMLLLLGYYFRLRHNTLNGFAMVFSYYFLFHIGTELNRINIKNIKTTNKIIIIICSLVFLIFLSKYVSFELAANKYGNPLYLVIASMAGWFMLYELATFIRGNNVLCKLFTTIGKNTLIIMSLHFLSFKLVSLLKVIVQGKPLFCIAAFPTFYGEEGLWWISYTLIGIIVPICLKRLFINIKREVSNNKKVDIL